MPTSLLRSIGGFPDSLVPACCRAPKAEARVCSQDKKSLGESHKVPGYFLMPWEGRERSAPSLSVPFGQNSQRGSSCPFSSQCPSWPLKAAAPCSGRQTRRGTSGLAGSRRRWVGGEMTAAFPWLTWSLTEDLATESQFCVY